MARYTSLRVGGPAEACARPASRAELGRLLALCRAHGLPVHVVGRGCNTLVRDGGVRGVVVLLSKLRALGRDAAGHLFAEAGVTHTAVGRFCVREGLAGLEFTAGIPGTVGGWLRMNAGIPEREMKDVTLRIECFDPAAGPEGSMRDLRADELRWRYRELELPSGSVILAGTFATRPEDPGAIRARMRELLARRAETQPVNERSCGSVFKNPEGDHAGRLIDAAGLKGARSGGAQISTVHANFIVNRGDATASDVLALVERARREVLGQFGVELEPEVQILGEAE